MSGRGDVASGISHGCVPIGTKRTITRSKGNIIYEIDGIPALEALKDYAEEDWKTQWNKLSLNLCLGFKTPEHMKKDYGEFVVRYMVGKDDREGSVTIQSDVRDGTEFWMVRRDKELIRDGLQAISRQIEEKRGSRRPEVRSAIRMHGAGKGRLQRAGEDRVDQVPPGRLSGKIYRGSVFTPMARSARSPAIIAFTISRQWWLLSTKFA